MNLSQLNIRRLDTYIHAYHFSISLHSSTHVIMGEEDGSEFWLNTSLTVKNEVIKAWSRSNEAGKRSYFRHVFLKLLIAA